MLKRLVPTAFISVIALALHVFAAFPLAFAQEPTFGDVKDTHKNFTAIEYLVSIGTLQGYDDGTFKPGKTINRAEMMKVLVAGQGLDPDAAQYKGCFPDVGEEWFARFVCYAKEQEWVGGYPDGTFKPANPINKVESIKMLVNALGLAGRLPETVAETLFTDTDSGAWYAPYIKVAKDLGLLEETGSTFNPTGEKNRGGVAENIFRTLVSKNQGFTAYTKKDGEDFVAEEGLTALEEDDEEILSDFGQEQNAVEFNITARQWSFDPAVITVNKGDTVLLHIQSVDVTHGFAITEFNVNSTLTAGQTTDVEFVADQAGTFSFFCSVFCGSGHSDMQGTLIVEE